MSCESHELYVYSTKTYLEKGLVKVGQCAKGRSDERIHEQFGTSNPEPPIKLWVAELPVGKTDHDVHHQLLTFGVEKIEDSPGREWFKATVDDVKKAVNVLRFGVPRIDSFPLRKEQQEAVDKALKWFREELSKDQIESATHKDRFLLNAKMRFGKCFTGIHIAKGLKATKVLIVTYKPEVISEWMNAVNNHVAFGTWLGVRAREPNSDSSEPFLPPTGELPNNNGPIVVCASLQDLRINNDGTTKVRLKNVVDTHWDLIVFDEVHFGSKTERAQYIIDSLHWRKRLDLSGTPFRLIQEDDFCPEQVFTYSYLDEQQNKRLEIENDPENKNDKIYRVMPDLVVSTIEITESDLDEQRETFLTDDLDISLNELFKVSHGTFIHDQAVDHFVDGLTKRTHDARSISVFGKLGDSLGVPAKRHSVWWLNRVDAVKALAKKLKRHPYFSQFEVINAAGCDMAKDATATESILVKDKETVEKRIKSASGNPQKLGTITLTVRRFLTGVTIRRWESILILNDVTAPESYYQAIFRVQSVWQDDTTKEVLKPKAWVFDFAISRCLRLTYHYADALADQLDQQDSYDKLRNDNLQLVVEGLCESLDIKRFYEGSLTPNSTSAKDIFEAINFTGSRVSLAKRITSDALVSFTSLASLESHPHLLEALKRVKGYRTQEVGGVDDFLKIGLEAAKLKDASTQLPETEEEIAEEIEDFIESEEDKEKRTKKKWYATQIKRLAICISDFVYMTQYREHKIDHVIETKEAEFFQNVTGITKDEFREFCDLGFINKQALNRIVREFRCQEESSLNAEDYVENYLKKDNYIKNVA